MNVHYSIGMALLLIPLVLLAIASLFLLYRRKFLGMRCGLLFSWGLWP